MYKKGMDVLVKRKYKKGEPPTVEGVIVGKLNDKEYVVRIPEDDSCIGNVYVVGFEQLILPQIEIGDKVLSLLGYQDSYFTVVAIEHLPVKGSSPFADDANTELGFVCKSHQRSDESRERFTYRRHELQLIERF